MACGYEKILSKTATACGKLTDRCAEFALPGRAWRISVDPAVCANCEAFGSWQRPIEKGNFLYEIFRDLVRDAITGGAVPTYHAARPVDYDKIWTALAADLRAEDSPEKVMRDAVLTQAAVPQAIGGETCLECEVRLRAFARPRGLEDVVDAVKRALAVQLDAEDPDGAPPL